MTWGRKTGGKVFVERIQTCQQCHSQFTSIDKSRGKRPQKFCSVACHKEAMKLYMQERQRKGIAHKFDEKSRHLAREALKLHPEKMLEANKRIGIAKRGCKNPPGPSAASPEHWGALYWKIRSPDRIIIEGWNLSDLIRKNSHMFNSEDIKWKKHSCRAAAGIRNLYLTRKKSDGTLRFISSSWKGWTAINKLPICK